ASSDVVDAVEDTAQTVAPLDNDADPDGDAVSIIAIAGVSVNVGDTVELPAGGTATLNADGTLTVTPAPNANGPLTFVYTISDGEGGVSTASIELEIAPVDDAPETVAEIEVQSSQAGSSVELPTASAFNDADGEDLQFAAEGLPPGLSIDPATGVISGTLSLDSAQSDPFRIIVTATDASGASAAVAFDWQVDSSGADVSTLIALGDAGPDSPDTGAGGTGDDNASPGDAFSDVASDEGALENSAGSIAVDGAVVEAANGVANLGGIASIGSEGVILSTVNGVSSLDGVSGARDNAESSAISGDRSTVENSNDPVEGFSSRSDLPGAESGPSANADEFIIDTYLRDRVLFVEAYEASDGSYAGSVAEYKATLADGRPLPSWISHSSDGVFMIERPANVETVALKIIGIREGGEPIVRSIVIDAVTGEMRDINADSRASAAIFSEEIARINASFNP
ncbi:MAG: putative Ig domain-containing protein, partial [Pseudomonadota bacterium]